jgi:hypothetical protein
MMSGTPFAMHGPVRDVQQLVLASASERRSGHACRYWILHLSFGFHHVAFSGELAQP